MAISPPLPTQTLDKLATPEFWLSLNPGMTISDQPFLRPPWPLQVEPQDMDRCVRQMKQEGYFKLDSALPAAEMERMARVIIKLVNEGFPPAFAFVYDEFWRVFRDLSPLATPVFGQHYRLVTNFWAWHIPPTGENAGFGPHRDLPGAGAEVMRPDGLPWLATVWIPLRDVTAANACMHLLPMNRDPNVPNNLMQQTVPHEAIQDIRALPAAAGSVLSWNPNVLHWGSRSSAWTNEPRISIAAYLKHVGDPHNLNSVSLAPAQVLSLEFRLATIGMVMAHYDTDDISKERYPPELLKFCEPYTRKYKQMSSSTVAAEAPAPSPPAGATETPGATASVPISAEETALRASVADAPRNPNTHLALAAWLRGHSRAREAAQSYQTVLSLRPNDLAIAVKLAATLIESSDLVAAENLLRKLSALPAPPAGVFYEIGKLNFMRGRREEAVSWLQRALQAEPANAEYCAFYGHVLSVLDRRDQAMTLFQRAAQLDPSAPEPWRQMALLVQKQEERSDRHERAEEYLKTACERAPDKPVFHCAYGDLLVKRARFTEALACYRRACDADPGSPQAIAGVISTLERMGDLTGAAQFARDALGRFPSHHRVLQAYAAVSRYIGEGPRAAELLEDLLARAGLAQDVRAEMHFALGKLYDHLKRYPEAFHNFREGNVLLGYRFNREEETQRFEAIMNAYPPALQRKRPRASNRSRLPVFIVGMPRSGTTLTEQILASHPLVHGAGELEDIHYIAKDMPQRLGLAQTYPYCMAQVNRRQLDTLAQAHLDRLGRLSRGMARVTDKLPHNFTRLGFIDLLFPGARVIHCRRDPVDNCLAIFMQNFTEGHSYASSLSDLGFYHRLYERLMDHWAKTVQIPVLQLRYEELIAEPERHIRELIKFCDLPWDERCLRFHEIKRDINTPSYDQVRRPIYKTSAGRWRHYAPFLGPLFEALGIKNPDVAPVTARN